MDYRKSNYCSKCKSVYRKDEERCPKCRIILRTRPKQSRARKKWGSRRV